MTKKRQFVFSSRVDGELEHIRDSGQMVSAFEYEGLEERLKVCQHLREVERERLKELEAFHISGRMNVEFTDDGVKICRGDHDKSAGCSWEYFARTSGAKHE